MNDAPRIPTSLLTAIGTRIRDALIEIMSGNPRAHATRNPQPAEMDDAGAPTSVVTANGSAASHPRWCPLDHSADHLGRARRYAMLGFRDGELAGTVTTDLEIYDDHDEFDNTHTWWEFPDGTVVATFGYHPSDLAAVARVLDGNAHRLLAHTGLPSATS